MDLRDSNHKNTKATCLSDITFKKFVSKWHDKANITTRMSLSKLGFIKDVVSYPRKKNAWVFKLRLNSLLTPLPLLYYSDPLILSLDLLIVLLTHLNLLLLPLNFAFSTNLLSESRVEGLQMLNLAFLPSIAARFCTVELEEEEEEITSKSLLIY